MRHMKCAEKLRNWKNEKCYVIKIWYEVMFNFMPKVFQSEPLYTLGRMINLILRVDIEIDVRL